MITLTIEIPDGDAELVTQLLKKLKVKIVEEKIPNALTAKVINEARKGKGLGAPITNVKDFMSSFK